MKPEEFESQWKRMPLRQVPGGWREEILAGAAVTGPVAGGRSVPERWTSAIRDWLWPHPVAWAGLAGCWMMIAILRTLSAPSPVEWEQARRDARVAEVYSGLLQRPEALRLLELETRRQPAAARRGQEGVGGWDDVLTRRA